MTKALLSSSDPVLYHHLISSETINEAWRSGQKKASSCLILIAETNEEGGKAWYQSVVLGNLIHKLQEASQALEFFCSQNIYVENIPR